MLHCPYCGTNVKEDEQFCIKCGKQLPSDIYHRMNRKKKFNKFWFLPLGILLLLLISSSVFYLVLLNYSTQAKELFEQGGESVLNEDYEEARVLFEESLNYKKNFPQAAVSLDFMNKALTVEAAMAQSTDLLEKQDYQQALSLITEAENDLRNFNGPAVNQLIEQIVTKRNTIKIAQLENVLEQEPNIDNLKILLWEADAINDPDANSITLDIKNQIIDFTFSRASEQLNKKQFNDAYILVEDGLKYAPDSEKLLSLQTTIENEQDAFETAQQQRLEQAMNTAAEEQQVNENDAIDLLSAAINSDDQGRLVVKGEVKSVATIPINSILVEYALLNREGIELLSNEIYVYPDRLYPGEKGNFEFTHFDMNEQGKNLEIVVNKITWYTD
ncbi:zinc ribbon domain-containing protein [Virgibacillus tibetensis]